ncbi:MAG: hypothetical protein CMB31_02410 [Euryarchaeota archaeon]|nr:hypothetical protein [Euryarchaeota archaeon]
MVFLFSSFAATVSSPVHLIEEQEISYSNEQLYDYEIFVAEKNDSAGGDGFLTTEEPTGSQKEIVVSEDTAEFKSPRMLSDLYIEGYSGDIEFTMWYKAVAGTDSATATFTVQILNDGQIVSEADEEFDACQQNAFGSNCGSREATIEVPISVGFTVLQDNQLTIRVSADMSGCESSGGGTDPPGGPDTEARQFGGSECSATLYFGAIDGGADQFTMIEIKSNALSNSILLVQKDGAEMIDGAQLDWYPNDIISERTMQFRFEVKSAFGRFDINSVRLTVLNPSGSLPVDEPITGSLDGVEDTSWSISGTYDWEYPGGLEDGEYQVSLEISDIGGNTIVIEHENIIMNKYGVALRHGESRATEYIAPSQVTSIPLQLMHRGTNDQMSVSLSLVTSFNSNWNVSFDAPAGYNLNEGGSIVNPILTLQAPQDLANSPTQLHIRAVAEAMVDGQPEIVSQEALYLDLEKSDVYAPPMVSMWDNNQTVQYDNSSRPDSFDSTIPRFVEDGVFTTFIMEIWNNGFDTDEFRVDVLERSKSIIQVFDNDTGIRILEDEGDGTFHTALLGRHSTQVLQIRVKPSDDRSDSDLGLIHLEVTSEGNSTKKSTVQFTIQRTFGIQATPIFDCDGAPLGTVNQTACTQNGMSMRLIVTNSLQDGSTSTPWRLMDPADLQRNLDVDEMYSQWVFRITDNSGDSVPMLQLAPQQSEEVHLSIDPPDEVEMGSHTLYLRIMEDSTDSDARYFDMPFIVEIGPGSISLEVVQVSNNPGIQPNEERSLQMRVKNKGNQELIVEIDIECSDSATSCDGWDAEIGGGGGDLVMVPPYSDISFVVVINAPQDARQGESVSFSVSASPKTFADEGGEEYENARAELNLVMNVEIQDIVLRITNEVLNPSPVTLISAVVTLLIVVLGVQNRRNRRRWVDEFEDEFDEEDEFELEDLDDLPPTIVEAEEDEFDLDIELID